MNLDLVLIIQEFRIRVTPEFTVFQSIDRWLQGILGKTLVCSTNTKKLMQPQGLDHTSCHLTLVTMYPQKPWETVKIIRIAIVPRLVRWNLIEDQCQICLKFNLTLKWGIVLQVGKMKKRKLLRRCELLTIKYVHRLDPYLELLKCIPRLL